jgi:protein required for attachment to host cells
MNEFPQTWVMVADRARARVFEWTNHSGPLQELSDFANPRGRLKEGELTSDRPSATFSSKGHQSAHPTQPPKSAVESAADEFARSLIGELKAGLDSNSCKRLVLIAPPQFLGLLRSHFDKRLEQAVAASLDLDLTRESADAIFSRLPKLTSLD